MVATAQGIDTSAFQNLYSPAELKAYAFAIFKATNGTSEVDPNFRGSWANGKAAGIHRGAYHELTAGNPADQAAYFIAAVKAVVAEPGDILAVVVSDYQGVSDADAKTCLDAVKAAFPHCIVMIYCDLSELPNFGACKGFPLWLAAYQGTWPSTPGWDCKIWQWGDGGGHLDHDAFNGDAAQMTAWVDSYKTAAPKPPAPTPTPVKAVTGVQAGWRFCWKCKTLFYGPDQSASKCPDGGTHDGSKSYDYELNYIA